MPPKPLITDKLSFAVPEITMPLWQVVWAGMGAMIGAGIFVGLGIAAGGVDRYLLVALLLAAGVALGSGWSRIQLVDYHRQVYAPMTSGKFPHSDVYGYSEGVLNSWLGFTAAWSLALSLAATAATAAIGASGYLLQVLPLEAIWQIPIALFFVLGLVGLLWQGLQPLQWFRQVSTVIGILTLLFFTIAGILSAQAGGTSLGVSLAEQPGLASASAFGALSQVLRATSLLVVAFAGFDQIARLAQTPQAPRWQVWQASGWILMIVVLLYAGVAIAAVAVLGTRGLGAAVESYGAPLAVSARSFALPGSHLILSIGATLTLLGTVGYLLVELVRVLWLMGQRRDFPKSLARNSAIHSFPPLAILGAAGGIAFAILANNIDGIWIFAAFSFLLHTTITHFAAAQLSPDIHPPDVQRAVQPFRQWFALCNTAVCLFLILWLDWRIWLTGAGLVVVGLVWRGINLWVAEQSEDAG